MHARNIGCSAERAPVISGFPACARVVALVASQRRVQMSNLHRLSSWVHVVTMSVLGLRDLERQLRCCAIFRPRRGPGHSLGRGAHRANILSVTKGADVSCQICLFYEIMDAGSSSVALL